MSKRCSLSFVYVSVLAFCMLWTCVHALHATLPVWWHDDATLTLSGWFPAVYTWWRIAHSATPEGAFGCICAHVTLEDHHHNFPILLLF